MYQRKPGDKGEKLDVEIEKKLDGVAQVFVNCADGGRPYDQSRDKIRVERDGKDGKNGKGQDKIKYPVAVPMEICETADGKIDLDYLKSYVDGFKNLKNDEERAYALLGMYFLSRCR